ncbi:MAG: amidohydrolase family protein, partial [Vicinamibacterales bacterium]
MTLFRRTIPLLRDRHSHPLLYAALMDAVDLSHPGETRESAVELVRMRAVNGGTKWTMATGWHSGRFALDKADFDDLPPIAILNVSLHGLIVNEAGRTLLLAYDELVAAHVDDQDWIERNLRRVLNVFARAGAKPDRLKAFFGRLQEMGVHHVEEMLLVGEEEIRLFDKTGLAGRTRFWAAPETYDFAMPTMRHRIHGIKLFTDGAIGVTTAAVHEKYQTADHKGLLLYGDDDLAALIARYTAEKPMAIHAIGDAAIDQVVLAVETVGREIASR